MKLARVNDNWSFQLRCFACNHFHQDTHPGLGVYVMGQYKIMEQLFSGQVRDNLAMHIFRSFGTAVGRHTNSNLTLTLCFGMLNLSCCFEMTISLGLYRWRNSWAAIKWSGAQCCARFFVYIMYYICFWGREYLSGYCIFVPQFICKKKLTTWYNCRSWTIPYPSVHHIAVKCYFLLTGH